MKTLLLLCYSLLLISQLKTVGQTNKEMLPQIIGKEGRHALLVDGKPFFILGGQVHNSSGWPEMMPGVWKSIEALNANTLEIPLYWEQVEPRSGEFNFTMIDTLLTQARDHNIRLVLLWFATWKNGSNHYMPDWMKNDPAKYPNIIGPNGHAMDSPDPNGDYTLQADKKAFAQVMKYLKSKDPQHTVIMMQVENEPGSWGTVRDYSPRTNKLLEGSVPGVLLKPGLLESFNPLYASGGSWNQVFGERADEYFQAWSIARFIDQVAAAGKAEYNLPLYVNAALRDPLTNPKATNYESGGATDNVISLWKIAAPHIDLVAPDIYLSGSENVLKVLDLYTRPDNALFVPELGLIPQNAKWLYPVLGLGGIGFSPFGIDDNGRDNSDVGQHEKLRAYSEENQIASPMMRELANWSFEGKITALVERENHATQHVSLGNWEAIVRFGYADRNIVDTNANADGKIMFIKLNPDEFLVMGTRSHLTFQATCKNTDRPWQFLTVEEGYYKDGVFHTRRILNGDETDWGGPSFYKEPVLLRIRLGLR